MATQTLTWCSAEQLACTVSDTTVGYICVNAALLSNPPASTYGYITAFVTGVRASTCHDYCGSCKYVYTLSYDDAQVVSGYLLSYRDIHSVLCDNCLTDFVVSRTSCDYIQDCVSPEYCWTNVFTEDELIAVNDEGAGGAVVSAAITLSADLTLEVPVEVSPCGSIITNGHTLTINASFEAGLYQVFTTGVNQVTFGIDSGYEIHPEWFGAIGDGVIDDTNALQGAINSGATYYVPIKLKMQKQYAVSQLTIPTRTTMFSDGYWNTGAYIVGTAANPLLVFPTGADAYIKLKGILLNGASISTSLIKQDLASYCQIEDCVFLNAAIGLDHSGGGILNNFLRCKFTGALTQPVKISGISNQVIFTACRWQSSTATSDIFTDTSWVGDNLIVRDSTFESNASAASSVILRHPTGVEAQHFLFEGNRWDAAKTTYIVDIGQYCRGTLRSNGFQSNVPTVIGCDGDYVIIDANYITTNSASEAIVLSSNSRQCYIGPNNYGGIPLRFSDAGTGNVYWNRQQAGPSGFYAVPLKGITANRPTLLANAYGFMYMDTTLDADGKPIWWNGVAWVDATGAVV